MRLAHAKTALFFLGVTLLLTGVGLLFVFEASVTESYHTFADPYALFKRQLLWAGLGWAAICTALFIPLKWWDKLAPIAYWGSILLLCLVFIPGIGQEFNGAHRWIAINNFNFQPIEVLKLSVALYFGHWLQHHQRFLPFVALTALPVLLLLLQPDFDSALIILGICFGSYFAAQGKFKQILPLALGVCLLLAFAVFGSSYRRERVFSYLNPALDPLGSNFQIRQITLALGRGGWMGQGLGNSKQKLAFIPEASSDSIFAIVAEELGFIGTGIILLLFFIFFLLAYRICQNAPAFSFAQLLAFGLITWIVVQFLLNIGAILVIIPLSGLPLPFFSYGGTALIMTLLACGILSRVALENKV